MRAETRLLLFATTFGATVGAYAAVQLSSGTRLAAPPRHAGSTSTGHDVHSLSVSLPIDSGPEAPLPGIASAEQNFAPVTSRDSLPPPTATKSEAIVAQPSACPSPSAPAAEQVDQVVRAIAFVAWSPPDDPSKSEQLCMAGEPLECLRLAASLDARTKTRLEMRNAQTYRDRAYSLLVLKCHQRNPDACVTIARMHALGFGLPKNPESEKALVDRARALCKGKTAAVCAAFGP